MQSSEVSPSALLGVKSWPPMIGLSALLQFSGAIIVKLTKLSNNVQ